jgi:hypothetical protein
MAVQEIARLRAGGAVPKVLVQCRSMSGTQRVYRLRIVAASMEAYGHVMSFPPAADPIRPLREYPICLCTKKFTTHLAVVSESANDDRDC